jgi:hypothetical protein
MLGQRFRRLIAQCGEAIEKKCCVTEKREPNSRPSRTVLGQRFRRRIAE